MDKVSKFNKYEMIFLRIHLALLGFGALLFGLLYAVSNSIDEVARVFLGIVNTLLFVVIINFVIAIFRLVKYFIVFRKSDVMPSIRRTVIIILTSPVSLAIYFILTLAMSLSLASCS